MVLAGGRHDTISGNRIEHNGAWGVLLVPFPDTGNPPPVANCAGGVQSPGLCYFDDWGNEIARNTSRPTARSGTDQRRLGDVSGLHTPGNCYHGQRGPCGCRDELTDQLQATHGRVRCGEPGCRLREPLAAQVICDTEVFGPCADAPGMHYPRRPWSRCSRCRVSARCATCATDVPRGSVCGGHGH